MLISFSNYMQTRSPHRLSLLKELEAMHGVIKVGGCVKSLHGQLQQQLAFSLLLSSLFKEFFFLR